MGVGSTACAAVIHQRRVAGADTVREYLEVARARVKLALGGKLRRRPLGKPIYKPGPNDRIARRPQDWSVEEPYSAPLFS